MRPDEISKALSKIAKTGSSIKEAGDSLQRAGTILKGYSREFILTQNMVTHILMNAEKFEWDLQGFGLLRLRINSDLRLHIWDDRYRVPNVSMIHDHLQWHLTSTVVFGELENIKYELARGGVDSHWIGRIKPGIGGETEFDNLKKQVQLNVIQRKLILAGETYSQRPTEIHETKAKNGTVTLMSQVRTGVNAAHVFWPIGLEWTGAWPRKATKDEIQDIVGNALF